MVVEQGRPYSVKTLAARWGCSETPIRRQIANGTLKAFRIGDLWRIPAVEVERIEQCQTTDISANNADNLTPDRNKAANDFAAKLARMK